MAKRILSGIFLLTALGALGVILAGALTSGEQLIVRFLTAVTVAALALYVISDLRLQSESAEVKAERQRRQIPNGFPPESTVDYMATVTGPQRLPREAAVAAVTHPNPTSTFEAIETVTQPTTTIDLVKPPIPPLISVGTAEVDRTGLQPKDLANSRLIQPPDHGPNRAVPPHPNTALSRRVKPSEAPTEPILGSLDDTAPLPKIDMISTDHVAENNTGAKTDVDEVQIDVSTIDLASAAEQPVESQVFASASYVYSGPLTSDDTQWPPTQNIAPLEEATPSTGPSLLKTIPDHSEEVTAAHETIIDVDDSANDQEYGPVTVDELLGQLDHDLSTPPTSINDPLSISTGLESTNSSSEAVQQVVAVDRPFDGEPTGPGQEDSEHGKPQHYSEGSLEQESRAEPTKPHLTLVRPDTTSASRQIAAAEYAEPARAELIDLRSESPVEQPNEVEDVPAPPTVPNHDEERLDAAIRSGEIQVIRTLIQQGMLTTDGAISDRDVRTMVYVAFTSNELRKLIRSGGTPDLLRTGDLDLGPVELFDEQRYAPLPKRIYDPSTNRPMAALPSISNESTEEANTSAHPPLPTPKHIYRKAGTDVFTES